ncbi:MAG: hypothetical protein WCT40_03360 [Candidatus Magasanikbacteria bacterium]|jgi:hypothetical protein
MLQHSGGFDATMFTKGGRALIMGSDFGPWTAEGNLAAPYFGFTKTYDSDKGVGRHGPNLFVWHFLGAELQYLYTGWKECGESFTMVGKWTSLEMDDPPFGTTICRVTRIGVDELGGWLKDPEGISSICYVPEDIDRITDIQNQPTHKLAWMFGEEESQKFHQEASECNLRLSAYEKKVLEGWLEGK